MCAGADSDDKATANQSECQFVCFWDSNVSNLRSNASAQTNLQQPKTNCNFILRVACLKKNEREISQLNNHGSI